MKDREKWFTKVCKQYALGKITERIMRKYASQYEYATRRKK